MSSVIVFLLITGENHKLEWSAGVSIVNNNDLFIRVPYYGDVKLTIINTACTTYLRIESVSQVCQKVLFVQTDFY